MVSTAVAASYSGDMGTVRRRLEAGLLVLVLLCAGSAPLFPEAKEAGCGCPLPCVRCCCASDAPGGAEVCLLRDRDSTPRSELPLMPRLWAPEAVFASPARLPHPALEGRFASLAFLLPVSLSQPPEVPPPRRSGAP